MTTVAERLVAFGRDLPLPGGGDTPARLRRLWEAAAIDPGFGRLAEAHADALAILAEAGRPAAPDEGPFGVWAARGAAPLRLDHGDGWRLTGELPWCSGVGVVSAALIAAEHDGRSALVVVRPAGRGITSDAVGWQSPAFPDLDTRTLRFEGAPVADADLVALGGWYLERPGFWHGAVAVAACWAGAAAGLVERVRTRWRADPHALAHLGAVDADLWQLQAVLAAAGQEIDHHRADVGGAHRRALRVRHVVDTTVADITTRLARALGPTPLALAPEVHRVLVECDLFRRQCHAERDLEALGRLVRS